MFASLMSVFENRVLREMPEHKRSGVTGEWRSFIIFFSWLDNCSVPRPDT
jgi:hypothetical protein